MHAKLVVINGEDSTRQFDLRLPAIIGRSRSTDVTLCNPLISRQHCEVFEADGHLMLRDLGSLNGTFVGDTRLASEPIELESGVQFTIGPLTLKAEYQVARGRSQAADWQPGGPTMDSPLPGVHEDGDQQ